MFIDNQTTCKDMSSIKLAKLHYHPFTTKTTSKYINMHTEYFTLYNFRKR